MLLTPHENGIFRHHHQASRPKFSSKSSLSNLTSEYYLSVTLGSDGLNSMVSLKGVQGRIYRFKTKSEYMELGIPIPVIESIVRCHMVLVLDVVRTKRDYVKIMTITSSLRDDGEYIPISPTPKKNYPIQIRLRNQLIGNYHYTAVRIPMLPLYSYLKIDSYYEVPIQMLDEVVDSYDEALMICAKHRGGLAELRDHIRRRDQDRESNELAYLMEATSLEGYDGKNSAL
ncbi:hypothetical protein VTL71DRAFT_13066 [Oculimacula yallundae]|uniref:Uncharacterized protein n=1 Tax=Oculimacula yallundae TaxID=86028 RepID=A0ABR4CPD5_9HELO